MSQPPATPSPAPIKFDRDALYSRPNIADMLGPHGVDVGHFLARLAARKVFKQLWLGEDLIAAYRQAPDLKDRAGAAAQGQCANVIPTIQTRVAPAELLARKGKSSPK